LAARLHVRLFALGASVALSAGLLAFVGAGEAGAETAEPVAVELDAPLACSTAERFFAEVRARTAHVRRAAAEETPTRTLRVRLEVRSSAVEGELVLEDAHGAATRRSLSGESCEAVVSGLALVAALAIDPQASTAPSVATATAPAVAVVGGSGTAPLPTAAAPEAADAGADTAPPVPAPSTQPALQEEVRVPVRARAPSESSRLLPPWHLGGGVEGEGLGFAAPGAVFGGGLFVSFSRDERRVFDPAFRLEAVRTLKTSVDVTDGAGSFVWTFGRAEGCPVRFRLVGSLGARPCAIFDLGVVDAAGEHIDHPASPTRPWVAAGALGRLEWQPVGPLWLEGSLGLDVPLLRESFVFEPATGIYQAPNVMLFGGLAVGVRFP
jgi:hypothetical protein